MLCIRARSMHTTRTYYTRVHIMCTYYTQSQEGRDEAIASGGVILETKKQPVHDQETTM